MSRMAASSSGHPIPEPPVRSKGQVDTHLVVEDGGLQSTVGEACGDVFSLVLHLRRGPSENATPDLRARVEQLLDATERKLIDTGLSDLDREQVMFALVATLDEAVAVSDWDRRHEWIANPLQLVRYEHRRAGTEFFDRIAQLMESESTAEPTALGVYATCVGLGFEGRFLVRPDPMLADLKQQLSERLRSIDPDTLSAHGIRKDKPIPLPPDGVPLWVTWSGAGVIIVAIYVALSFMITRVANDVLRSLGG